MKIDLEFSTDNTDKAEVLSKLLGLVKTAQQDGLNLEEMEMESEDGDLRSDDDDT